MVGMPIIALHEINHKSRDYLSEQEGFKVNYSSNYSAKTNTFYIKLVIYYEDDRSGHIH